MGIEEEFEEEHGGSYCFGSERILIIDVDGDLEDMEKAAVLKEVNSSYPDDLVDTHPEI